jgi:hypothetical protein
VTSHTGQWDSTVVSFVVSLAIYVYIRVIVTWLMRRRRWANRAAAGEDLRQPDESHG